MTASSALDFVKTRGIVLERARGPIPNLVETIAGERIRGSWWAHPKAHAIYGILVAVRDKREILACRLVDGKMTLVHRRVWPALVRLAGRWPKERLAAVRQVHTPTGKHEVIETPFPKWVPDEVMKRSRRLDEDAAVSVIGESLARHLSLPGHRSRRPGYTS